MKNIELKDLENLTTILFDALKTKTQEYQRAFHGRGGVYEGFEFLTIDFIDKLLFVTFFNQIDKKLEEHILKILEKLYLTRSFNCVVLQRRYINKAPSVVLHGEMSEDVVAIENNLKFSLNIMSTQNIGLFADMKAGREFVKENAKNKKVLNLFSYTCAFSVYAMSGGAKEVVNVDMSKPSLTLGRVNHRINNLDTKKVTFMPHNILKSWNKIKKSGPYDLIIIDPPSFQKGSFAVTKDYEKIIKRLNEFANSDCMVLACLNDPQLDSLYVKAMFEEMAPQFTFEKRLKNLKTFPSLNEEKSLKNLVFTFHS